VRRCVDPLHRRAGQWQVEALPDAIRLHGLVSASSSPAQRLGSGPARRPDAGQAKQRAGRDGGCPRSMPRRRQARTSVNHPCSRDDGRCWRCACAQRA
jgi:hypothetical protein